MNVRLLRCWVNNDTFFRALLLVLINNLIGPSLNSSSEWLRVPRTTNWVIGVDTKGFEHELNYEFMYVEFVENATPYKTY